MKLLRQFFIVLLVSLWAPALALLVILPLALWGYRPEEGEASVWDWLPLAAWFLFIWGGSLLVSLPIWLIHISIDPVTSYLFAGASFALAVLLTAAYFQASPRNDIIWGFVPLPQTALQVGILLGALVAIASLPSWVFLAATHLRRWMHRHGRRTS